MPLLFVIVVTASLPAQPTARVWTSTRDMQFTLTEREPVIFGPLSPGASPAADFDAEIIVDPQKTYQTMLGMGSSFEPTTCFNLSRLTPAAREEAIEKLVSPEKGIGFNLIRICIGTPDFTGDPWYSYDDMPAGEKDPELKHFSIEKDRAYILPALKIARAKNPDLLFFASPWSPPGWMKSTDSMIGGRLLPENYAAYARYFVRFIQEYEKEGIPIYAVTVQNEPGVDRSKDEPSWYYPSCRWTGEEERDFIRDHLGPAFAAAGIKTKIWCYDHNFNTEPTPDGDDPGLAYPATVLGDAAAARFVDATAFHGYEGKADNMTLHHERFPGKPIIFSEGSVFDIFGAVRLTAYLRNWASGYNGWVTIIDTKDLPNNGPFKNNVTCVMLDHDNLTLNYRFDYYVMGQFMKFVRRGAVRIGSEADNRSIANVAFRNPDGEDVLVAANISGSEKRIRVAANGRAFEMMLPPRSVTTAAWRGF
ncbi:glycosyl hydrolase [Candidatus Sumerlaeota bacterium]|nr:glycosyl hydrolase [Candidatus Sumerlaeota bacterium]